MVPTLSHPFLHITNQIKRFYVTTFEASSAMDGDCLCARQVPGLGESIKLRNRNMMLSAPAGFGKSHIIRNVLRPRLERALCPQGLWVTALTGLAAVTLVGVTIQSASSQAGRRRHPQTLGTESPLKYESQHIANHMALAIASWS